MALAGYVVAGVVQYKLAKPGSFACNDADFSPAGAQLSHVMWCALRAATAPAHAPLRAHARGGFVAHRSAGASAAQHAHLHPGAAASLHTLAYPRSRMLTRLPPPRHRRVYYAQKFLEFGDTLFFILRTRFRQLTLLHVYHHVSITLITALFLRYDVNGDNYLPAAANSFVHVLMYSHYLAAAFGVDTFWKKQLTSLQLVQFGGVLAQSAVAAWRGPACGFPEWLKAVMVAYQVSMLALFGAFFVNSYLGARRRRREKGKAKAL